MRFQDLLTIIGDESLIETSLLLAGDVNPRDVHRQLSRWREADRLHQLRRGLYLLAEPYRKQTPHPFPVANRLLGPSYISCQSALAWYGMIPEYVPATVSVTTARTGNWTTEIGVFLYHHIKNDLFWGFQRREVAPNQRAFIARPEKALLDLIYLQPQGDDPDYLLELRLQNREQLRLDVLTQMAERSGSPKLKRAARRISALVRADEEVYETL